MFLYMLAVGDRRPRAIRRSARLASAALARAAARAEGDVGGARCCSCW